MQRGEGLEALEELIGPVERVQEQWHAYVRRMKLLIEHNDREFLKTGQIPQSDSSHE